MTTGTMLAGWGRAPIAAVDRGLLYAIILSGMTAGFVGDDVFFVLTPAAAVVVMMAARREGVSPARVVRDLEAPELPIRTRRMLDVASGGLRDGEARTLLAAVVRPARALFANRSESFTAADEERARTNAVELVEASCASALELDRLDLALEALPSPAGSATESRRSAPRDLSVSRLTDAGRVLQLLVVAGAEQGLPASDRVAELAAQLRAEAKARSQAKRDLEILLG